MAEVAAPSTVEINDAIFCSHFKEVVRQSRAIGGHRSPILQCTECSFDGREENDSFFGVGAAR